MRRMRRTSLREALSDPVGTFFLNPRVWVLRGAWTIISLISIWRVSIMSDVLVCTPAEFVPVLAVVGLVATAIPTLVMAKAAYNNSVKKEMRSGGDWFAFGIDYLSANIINIVVGTLACVLIGGAVYDALGATATYSGCILMGLVSAIIIGFGGQAFLSKLIDLFHDPTKISALKDALKAAPETKE